MIKKLELYLLRKYVKPILVQQLYTYFVDQEFGKEIKDDYCYQMNVGKCEVVKSIARDLDILKEVVDEATAMYETKGVKG